MRKLSKVLTMLVVILAVITITGSVKAYTNSDLKNYLSSAHVVNNMTFELSAEQKDVMSKYLDENKVSDDVATSIMADLQSVENKIAATGATDVSQISDSVKSEIVSTVKSAGNKAGLDVAIDTKNQTVLVTNQKTGATLVSKSYKGGNIVTVTKPASTGTTASASGAQQSSTTTTSGSTLLYTGANYTLLAISLVAIVAVAIVVKRRK